MQGSLARVSELIDNVMDLARSQSGGGIRLSRDASTPLGPAHQGRRLTKAGVKYSTLWSEDFTDSFFRNGMHKWLDSGRIIHTTPTSSCPSHRRDAMETGEIAWPI